jgi:hypothetical protein
MDARRGYAENSTYQIFGTVRNFGTREQKVNLELLRNGNLVAVRGLTIPAGGQKSQLFDNIGFSDGLFQIRFDADDDLKIDNTAYANLEPQRNIRVLMVSDGNLFLERALNINPSVELFRAAPNQAVNADYDVIVCDGASPKNLPSSNQLLFNTFTDSSPVTKGGIVNAPSVADWDRKHPVTRFSPWNDIRIAQAQAATLKPWAQALVESERSPLVVSGERGGKRVVWCGFDLRDSDLPLRVAFPIFVTNALRWLSAPRGTSSLDGAPLRAGETVALNIPGDAREVQIQAPDNTTRRVAVPESPLLYAGTDEVGVYTAQAGSGKNTWKKTFAVSLLNATESDLKPRDALKIAGGQQVTGATGARANRELWGFIALAALLLLSLEWWIYHRGV